MKNNINHYFVCTGILGSACIGRGGLEEGNLLRNLLGEVDLLLQNVVEGGGGWGEKMAKFWVT